MTRLLLPLLVIFTACATAADRPPNILLIMADDIGIEGFGCYGGQSYTTPQIDRLAATGLRFTHAYSQPLCTPTRVELMTGRYNHRNWRAFGLLDPAAHTFGHLLQAAGYQTCIAGKWQLHSYDPPDFPGAATRRGTGMRAEASGFDEHLLFHAGHTEDKGSRYANPTLQENGVVRPAIEGAYGENLFVAFLADFMKRHQQEPMFLYYPMCLPHWPMVPTPISEAWSDPQRRLDESTDFFPDMVRYMDQTVGRLIKHLDALGLRENTLILFYSDNGTDRRILSLMEGREIEGGKGEPTQTGIRVPLIANWPGKIEVGTCNDLIDASDFLPTLAELAHTTVPDDWGVEGRSFAPALFGKNMNPRDWCYFWYDPRPGWDKEKFTRHVFALDHHYKLFDDGRLFLLDDFLPSEHLIKTETPASRAAREKLQTVLDRMLRPPLSKAAVTDPQVFGRP
ncbi:MAG: sulfatase-like hydrolase/transferase [Verrucomicrobiales bacterium]|nr:sulfatase-like hydrolase/transferase [Verrucomicrobiales bacterium]